MFLDRLTGEQRRAFLALAYKQSLTDKLLDQQEKALLSIMRAEMKIEASWKPGEVDLDQLTLTFSSPVSRTIALFNLLLLALVDGEYHPRERQLIDRLAQLWKIDATVLAEIEQACHHYYQVQGQIEHTLFDRLSKRMVP